MRNITAIFKKQLKDTLKNKTVLIQFIMFPVLTLVMNQAVKIERMPENFFVSLFASMYIGMAPLTSIAAVIAEEKEKNTLRVLLFSDVKPLEFLLGIGIYIWFFCMLGAAVICAAGSFQSRERLVFMAVMALGITVSLLIGAAIGACSRNQMAATSLTIPVMMIFAFLPMLSQFNTTIAKIAKYAYSQQISILLSQVADPQIKPESIIILTANILAAAALFAAACRRLSG